MIIKMYRHMLGLQAYQLFVLLFTVSLFTLISIGFLIDFFGIIISSSNDFESNNKLSLIYFMRAVLFAPLLETAIFQKMIIGFCRTFIKNNLVCVTISAAIFGLLHLNGILKIIIVFPGGICLGLFYTILKRRRLNAFWLTALFHASWNLFLLTMNYFDL